MTRAVTNQAARFILFCLLTSIVILTLSSSKGKDLLSSAASASAAQKTATSSKPGGGTPYKLIALKVTGTARYTDKEILGASGLQIGQNAADADFKEAVRRLGDSGLFSEVVYSYTSSDNGTKLELQLADTDKSKLVPAHFENFVWFTDDELQAALQRSVPSLSSCCPLQAIFQTAFRRRCKPS